MGEPAGRLYIWWRSGDCSLLFLLNKDNETFYKILKKSDLLKL